VLAVGEFDGTTQNVATAFACKKINGGQILLNLFFSTPDPDRWLPYDCYPRRVIRRLVRGAPQISGQLRVFVNLRAGLDRIGVKYRVNDYRHAHSNPSELVCIVGKSIALTSRNWRNPVLLGAAIEIHPVDDPAVLTPWDVKKVLVPSQWVKKMCDPFWGDLVDVWPVGIDTDLWRPAGDDKEFDVLLYDKVRWEHDRYESSLIEPIRAVLRASGHSVIEIRYGFYREEDFHAALGKCRAMIFLCEHETQGIAYQQALSCGVPIMAWDRGGPWRDPAYFPDKIVFAPVTSVPYWDERCGVRFVDGQDFAAKWPAFWEAVRANSFRPRDYILENLTLERCARHYLSIAERVAGAAV